MAHSDLFGLGAQRPPSSHRVPKRVPVYLRHWEEGPALRREDPSGRYRRIRLGRKQNLHLFIGSLHKYPLSMISVCCGSTFETISYKIIRYFWTSWSDCQSKDLSPSRCITLSYISINSLEIYSSRALQPPLQSFLFQPDPQSKPSCYSLGISYSAHLWKKTLLFLGSSPLRTLRYSPAGFLESLSI